MTSQKLEAHSEQFTKVSPMNIVPKEKALHPRIAGMTIYQAPIFGYASADDTLFQSLKANPKVFLSDSLLPLEWMPRAKTVISFFLPFTPQVRESNKHDKNWPSHEWLNARIEGQEFIAALIKHIRAYLTEEGYESLAPFCDPRFQIYSDPANGVFTSNWSERHVAYVCGLGTFGLSKNIITAKGAAGRFGSVLTDLEVPATIRSYQHFEEYCSKCGICVKNCPAEAISIKTGKDNVLCKRFVDKTRTPPPSYYGCGKCQVDVPCEGSMPVI